MIDIGRFAHRFIEPFNPDSRFYWPAVIALGVALVANIVWYYARTRRQVAPAENAARPWAFWVNAITIIWIAVLFVAKVPFVATILSFALNGAVLVYLYSVWLPPLEAEWVRERRRARYLPKAKKKPRRR